MDRMDFVDQDNGNHGENEMDSEAISLNIRRHFHEIHDVSNMYLCIVIATCIVIVTYIVIVTCIATWPVVSVSDIVLFYSYR